MFVYLLLLFTLLPALELAVLIEVGTHIGTPNTILLIILTGVLGAGLARYQGFTTLRTIQENLNRGVMPTEPMLDGVMILIGGVVLLTPGFITDTLGFLLLVPLTRNLIKFWLRRRLETMVRDGQVVSFHTSRRDDPPDAEDAQFYE